MSETNNRNTGARQGEAILPAPIGEDGIVQPDRTAADPAAAGDRKPGPAPSQSEDAHDLAHGNDLKTP